MLKNVLAAARLVDILRCLFSLSLLASALSAGCARHREGQKEQEEFSAPRGIRLVNQLQYKLTSLTADEDIYLLGWNTGMLTLGKYGVGSVWHAQRHGGEIVEMFASKAAGLVITYDSKHSCSLSSIEDGRLIRNLLAPWNERSSDSYVAFANGRGILPGGAVTGCPDGSLFVYSCPNDLKGSFKLAVVGRDGFVIKSWLDETGAGGYDAPLDMVLSSDCRRLYVLTLSGKLTAWNWQKGKSIWAKDMQLNRPIADSKRAPFERGRMAYCCKGDYIVMQECSDIVVIQGVDGVESQRKEEPVILKENAICKLACSHGGDLISLANMNGGVRVYNLSEWALVASYPNCLGHGTRVVDSAFTKAGELVLLCDDRMLTYELTGPDVSRPE